MLLRSIISGQRRNVSKQAFRCRQRSSGLASIHCGYYHYSTMTRLMDQQENEVYYDSQSGKHVPIHDESNVKLFVQAPAVDKDLSASQINCWERQGVAGLLINPNQMEEAFPIVQDWRKQEITGSSQNAFQLWLPFDASVDTTPMSSAIYYVDYNSNPSADNDDDDSKQYCQEAIEKLAANETIGSAIACHTGSTDAVLTASGIASIIDATGGDYVLLRGGTNAGASLVELAEELGYLDVEGPTLKARMVIDVAGMDGDDDDTEDALEECLFMGINKYIIDAQRIEWMADFVRENGKTCDVVIDE